MKDSRRCLAVLLMVVLALSFGCSKKSIRTDAGPYSPPGVEPGAAGVKPGEKPEAVSPESAAALEKEKKLREDTLREETLREKALQEKALEEKALREKAMQEEAARKETEAREAALKTIHLESIFYDFDEWSIREDQKEVMSRNAEWLKAHPNVKVRVEGHCDERGTAEYNLALGQKRADAAKAFLEGLGVSSQRLSAISYGKELPLDPGHDEAAWAKNRRVDFVPIR